MLKYIQVVSFHVVKLLYSDEYLTEPVAVGMLAVGCDTKDSGSAALPGYL